MNSEATTELQQRKVRGRPFAKGRSGNPFGRPAISAKREQMLAAGTALLTKHHGRELNRPEELLLDELISVRLTKPTNATEATKRANPVRRLPYEETDHDARSFRGSHAAAGRIARQIVVPHGGRY